VVAALAVGSGAVATAGSLFDPALLAEAQEAMWGAPLPPNGGDNPLGVIGFANAAAVDGVLAFDLWFMSGGEAQGPGMASLELGGAGAPGASGQFQIAWQTEDWSAQQVNVDHVVGAAIRTVAGLASTPSMTPTPFVVLLVDRTVSSERWLIDAGAGGGARAGARAGAGGGAGGVAGDGNDLVTLATSTIVVPLRVEATLEDAVLSASVLASEFDESLVRTNDSKVISCISPWTGNNDIQCCAQWTAYRIQLGACRANFIGSILPCIVDGGVVWAACFFPCLVTTSASGAAATPVCANLCAALGGLKFLGCIFQRLAEWIACELQARVAAIESMSTNGCWPPPPEFPFP